MKCIKCETEMFKADLTGGLYSLMVRNKKKGVFEDEKRSSVSCYVCENCGYIALYADNPKDLKLDL